MASPRRARRACPCPILRGGLALALLALPMLALGLSEQRRFSDFAIDHWTVAEGLPQVAVSALGQDGDGYVWVGTQSAVARFDGVRFEVFDRRRSGGIDTSLSETAFRASDGHVWFGTRSGALRLRRDRVSHHAATGTPVPVQAITEWPAGRLLFGTPRGLYVLQGERLVPEGLEGTDVGALLQDGKQLWVGTTGRLLRREGSQLRSFALGDGEARVTRLLKRDGTLWIGTSRGLWRQAGDAEPVPAAGPPELARLPIEALCTDGGGSLWVGTAPRLYRLRRDGTVEAVPDAQFVRNAWVRACFEDREGNLWLGSQTESLFRLWDGLVSRLTELDGLADPFVWSLEDDGRGGVFIGSNSGLSHYRAGRVTPLVEGSALPDAAIYELARLPGNRLWLGTRGGLREWAQGRLSRPAGAEALEGAQINAIVAAGPVTWVGSSRGLFRHRAEEGLRPVAEGALEPGAQRIRALLPLDTERVLLGTEDGLREVQGDEVRVPEWAEGLRGRMVTSLLRLPNGALLAGTLDSGLLLASGERALLLDDRHGLPTLNAWALQIRRDWLYVSSMEGLYRLPLQALPDPARPGAEPATLGASWVVSMAGRRQSGQRARCCNGGARSRALLVGSQLWLPSISGVLRVDLEAIGSPGIEPIVHIEAASHGGRRLLPGDGPVVLGEGPRDLRFDFTALYFRSPQAMRFEYRLDGYDRDWVDAGERRSAFYTNLPPGDFQFRVRARDDAGHTVQSADVFTARVEPRLVERTEVRLLALLALLLAGTGATLLAMRQQRRHTARLEALVEERTALLQRANERLEQANEVLAMESQTDALTGLPNRRAVFQQIPSMLTAHPEGVVLALIDIDHFKQINDSFGHAAGDLVLRDFAAFLRRATREGDLLARWGGEEFLLVFAGLPDEAVPARLQRLLEDGRSLQFELGQERPLQVSFSVGWTRHPLGGSAPGDWLHTLELADAALYQAKANGRNTWVGLAGGPALGDAALGPHPGRRIAELVSDGRLHWVNLKGRLAAVPRESRAP